MNDSSARILHVFGNGSGKQEGRGQVNIDTFTKNGFVEGGGSGHGQQACRIDCAIYFAKPILREPYHFGEVSLIVHIGYPGQRVRNCVANPLKRSLVSIEQNQLYPTLVKRFGHDTA